MASDEPASEATFSVCMTESFPCSTFFFVAIVAVVVVASCSQFAYSRMPLSYVKD